jgi:hypothetical protein
MPENDADSAAILSDAVLTVGYSGWWIDLEDPRSDNFTFRDRRGKLWSRQQLLERHPSHIKPSDDSLDRPDPLTGGKETQSVSQNLCR